MTNAIDLIQQKETTVVDVIRWHAEQHPEQVCVQFTTDGEQFQGQMDYGALDRRARSIAAWLQTRGKPGDRVMMLFPPGLDFVASYFGCLYAGMVAIPLYPHLRPGKGKMLDRIVGVARDGEPVVVLTNEVVEKVAPALFELAPALGALLWKNIASIPESAAASWKSIELQSGDLAFLQYTSGSTSAPKGVMVSHRNLLHNCEQMRLQFGTGPYSKAVIWQPPYHDMGLIGGIIQPIVTGYSTILIPPVQFLQRPLRWLKTISNFNATVSGGPNFAFDYCVDRIKPEQRDELDLSSWTTAFSGAEPIHAPTLRRFAEYFEPCGLKWQALFPSYGLAEGTLMTSCGNNDTPPVIIRISTELLGQGRVKQVNESLEDSRELVGCGTPAPDLVVRIVEPETMETCPENHIGEIWVKGDSVARGYWKQQELTEETFNAFIKDTGEGPFLRTGDLGFFLDGELFVSGRIKDLIIIDGKNHFPQDIERTAEESHPAVKNNATAAFSIEKDNGEKLVLVVEVDRRTLRKLESADEEDIKKAITRAVSREHELAVHDIHFLPKRIPKTTSGKIQRHQCKKLYLEAQQQALT